MAVRKQFLPVLLLTSCQKSLQHQYYFSVNSTQFKKRRIEEILLSRFKRVIGSGGVTPVFLFLFLNIL